MWDTSTILKEADVALHNQFKFESPTGSRGWELCRLPRASRRADVDLGMQPAGRHGSVGCAMPPV
jgi:hypothetical protein